MNVIHITGSADSKKTTVVTAADDCSRTSDHAAVEGFSEHDVPTVALGARGAERLIVSRAASASELDLSEIGTVIEELPPYNL